MGAYRYELKNNKKRWYTKFTYCDKEGNKKQKCKRGFKTKKDALEYESRFKARANPSIDMSLKDFLNIYYSDMDGIIKKTTIQNKRRIIEKHLIPELGDKKIRDITTLDLRRLLNRLIKDGYELSTVKNIKAIISSIFSHAVKYYNLSSNPCEKIGKLPSPGKKKESIQIWTPAEFNTFISHLNDPEAVLFFKVMFYTGARLGEVTALNKSDIDYDHDTINIDKNLQYIDHEWKLQSTKTQTSARIITIPHKLSLELKKYTRGMDENERLFKKNRNSYRYLLNKVCKEYGLKRIRMHDFRHSHASLLIDMGYDPLVIKDRLGHDDISTTLNIYSHLYDSKKKEVAVNLNSIM